MKPNLMNSAMRNGLILGILFSVNFLFSISNNLFLGLLTYAMIGIIVYASYRFTAGYRDTDCEGVISYRHALAYVVLLFVFAALISAIVKYIFFQYLNPNFLPELVNKSMEIMEQVMPSVPEEMYDNMDTMMTPINYSLMVTWLNVILGFFVGLIVAGIVKKDKNPFDNQDNLPQNN